MQAFCGIDWAEDHHDIAIIDATGTLLARGRIGNDPVGYRHLLQLLADAGDSPEQPIPVAIETARGLLVACWWPACAAPAGPSMPSTPWP